MKRLRTIVLSCITIACGAVSAQDYYDLSEQMLKNTNFDTVFDYDSTTTGNQRTMIKVPEGWKSMPGSSTLRTVAITMQYGTKRTVYDFETPRLGTDGTDRGGFFVLGTTQNEEISFYQRKHLAAGNYKLVATYYNFNTDATEGFSRLGFIAEDGSFEVRSSVDHFDTGVWITDTVSFTLSKNIIGKVALGFQSAGGSILKSAIIAVDYVKLLRDTPYGELDESLPDVFVTADTRFARGATMAFGRIANIEGEDIVEQGFCWSENPQPTINDARTTKYLANNGHIYWLDSLKPTTRYYMRAYATNAEGKTGYSDVIKFVTIPKGNVTYWYNNGGDEAANKRINAAAAEACDIFNNLTSIRKHFSIGYSAVTPTADCYYADEPWMNMGANSSYQRTGTIMHEMQHGMGVIPYSTQWNKNILRESLDGSGRGTGHWLGDRVSSFLDFWDNTTGSRLNGDYQHLWPYGINGANEDNGTKVLYYANAMIGQALGEDGLEHNYQTFAEPYYSFNQEDTIKYYLKNENTQRGLETSYLMPTANGTLRWKALGNDEVLNNDSAAWYITFNPSNQYYQLRNAATGQYMTYSNSTFKTMERTNLTSNDNFHLMRGRVNVSTKKLRGYWLIHPQSEWDPKCLQANANGATAATVFNIANNATAQRWLILTAEEQKAFSIATSINDMNVSETKTPAFKARNNTVYSLDGRIVASDASQISSLPRGIYIVAGKKVVIGNR